ncbi:MAG: undecaprenyldiphospho-muramoylpentapeptide beta-N-acetylglucosaminyltransferase [Pseudomonadota bacterium]|nr:undecaprenyldiphospho-muramoylpentapeptide beta-N-acetylglucosaminyltransferase [Pseudomonadota bacterium]
MKKQQKKPLIVVTTGGSGGHIFPAEAIASALLKQGADVVFITDKRGSTFQGIKNVPVYRLMAESVTGRSIFGKIWAAIKLYIGTIQAVYLMYKLKPNAVVGVGGYASIPAVMAAHLTRTVPVVLHEQNAVLGRANRLLAKGARLIGTSFSPTLCAPKNVPQIQVGLPVRPAILSCRNEPYPKVKNSFHLFVFGGSQGARFFSHKLPEALLMLPENQRAHIELVQQVRSEDMEKAHQFYDAAGFKKVTLKSFFTDMPEQLKKAHLVIGRGGAGTLTELMAVGRPAIIVPLPSAADNHQAENARLFCDKGAGFIVAEKDFDPKVFAQRLSQLMDEPQMLAEAANHASQQFPEKAAEKMADAVLDIVKGCPK